MRKQKMAEINDDTMQDLIIWLCSHEDDIKNGIKDYGELEHVFFEIIGRKAGDKLGENSWPW